jgi:DsbC/DsbD-like thiol-disulfide interchange protein
VGGGVGPSSLTSDASGPGRVPAPHVVRTTLISRGRLLVSLIAFALLPQSGLAGDASPWVAGHHSKVRLLAGGESGGDMRRAAVEIVLDKGWKTYWRHPGDSGIPPRLDWSGSTNLARVDIRWPAPSRFEDAGGIAYGYADAVTFPLHVYPQNPAKPVVLKLGLDFGVCKEICIPARADLEATTSSRPGKTARLIEAAEARVPAAKPLGAVTAPAVVSLSKADPDAKRFKVAARAAPGVQARLFVEGPDGWYFDSPEPAVAGADGTVSLVIMVLERPKGGAHEATVILTLVAGEKAVETSATLDAGPPPR